MNTTQTITNPTPMAATVEEAARDVAKCLNERGGQGLDLRHVAMLAHHAHMSTFTPDVKTPSEPSPTAGMNMAQRILHVGGRNNAAGYVEFGSIQAVQALVLQFVRDMVRPPMRRVSDGWKTALQQIANWDSHDPMLGVDMGSNGVRDFYRQIARDALADAPTAPQGVPDGWQLVPKEPTPEMCAAAVVYANGNAVYKNVAAEALKIEESIYGEVFSAMLASAPPAPQAEKAAFCHAKDAEPLTLKDAQAAGVQQEPVAWLHTCRKKPELSELSFKKGEPELASKGYAARPLVFGDTHPAQQAKQTEPIDMVLHCPNCGRQHIDNPEPAVEHDGCTEPEFAHWDNPPHRSHLCHGCGHIWRPADVPTNGVQAVKTKGKADSPVAVPHNSWTKLHEACALAMEALEKERQFAHGKRDFSMLSVRAIEALREAFRDQTGG